MALITCPECSGQVSSKASTCPHCGCPMEISNFEFINMTAKDGNKIVRYIELANSALRGGNGQEAYDYANKALEIDPICIEALEAKLLSLQLVGTLGNLRIQEAIECGNKMMQYAPINIKEEIQRKVYTYYLNRALELLLIAVSQTQDITSIKKTFEQFALISAFSCGNNTLKADMPFVHMMEDLANGALMLKSQVPADLIHDDDSYQSIVVNISNAYEHYSQALVERYKVYGASLTDSAIEARKSTLEAFNIGRLTQKELQSLELKRVQEFWSVHPVEKGEIEQEISQKVRQKEDLLNEKKDLKIFSIARKVEIQQTIDELNVEIAKLQQKLETGQL